MRPILEMPAGGVKWLVPVLLMSVVLDLVLALVLAVTVDEGPVVALIIAVSSLPALVIIAFVIPVRYEIWAQKLTIVFLFGRRWDIPFSTIESAVEAKRWQPY